MFDFRYHALSLVAVLVALVVGVLLGVAIGDAGLVSSAEQNLRADAARATSGARRTAPRTSSPSSPSSGAARSASSRRPIPLLVGGRLRGRRVGALFLGTPSQRDRATTSATRSTNTGGARSRGRSASREPPDLGALAERGRRHALRAISSDDPTLLEPFGRRIGVAARRRAASCCAPSAERAVLDACAGALGPFDGVVVARASPSKGLTTTSARSADALEDGIVQGPRRDNPVRGRRRRAHRRRPRRRSAGTATAA